MVRMDGASEERRVDYVKCLVRVEYDRAESLAAIWYATFGDAESEERYNGGCKVTPVRIMQDGRRLYSFEAWGPTAIGVMDLDWSVWSPHLARLDVREGMEVTHAGIDALYHHLQAQGRGSRNVHLFDTRKRQKSRGRSAGGVGVAIGSHKSDVRITFYKRADERGAMEFQFGGNKLQRLVSLVQTLAEGRERMSNLSMWSELEAIVAAQGQNELTGIAGLSADALQQLVYHGHVGHSVMEHKLEQVDNMLRTLDTEALRAVQATLWHMLGPD